MNRHHRRRHRPHGGSRAARDLCWFEHGGSRVGRAPRTILFVLNMAVRGWVARAAHDFYDSVFVCVCVCCAWWFASGPRAARDFFGLNMVVRGWVARSPRFFWFEHGGPRVGRAQRAIC